LFTLSEEVKLNDLGVFPHPKVEVQDRHNSTEWGANTPNTIRKVFYALNIYEIRAGESPEEHRGKCIAKRVSPPSGGEQYPHTGGGGGEPLV